MAFAPDQIRVTNALPPPPQSGAQHVYQTTFYPSLHEWVERCMKADHLEFNT